MNGLNNTPNMELGKVVAETLVSEGLIVPENKESILTKICGGRMTASEWTSCVEITIIKDEGIEGNGKSDQED